VRFLLRRCDRGGRSSAFEIAGRVFSTSSAVIRLSEITRNYQGLSRTGCAITERISQCKWAPKLILTGFMATGKEASWARTLAKAPRLES